MSGLSGTVVLQDNGGDDLSVSSDGAFTFATPLVSGAHYDVTVKSDPSGQTCTVVGRRRDGGVGERDECSGHVLDDHDAAARWQDDFDRADGGLGAGWPAMGDGGLSIASQAVVGTPGALAGDIRVAESYGSDQYSQIEVTSTQLSGGQWIGPAVRARTVARTLIWGSILEQRRSAVATVQAARWQLVHSLGASYASGPLPAGTKLTVSAVGSQISFAEDGVERIAVTDSTLTGGAPGIMTFGAATADNWPAAPRPRRPRRRSRSNTPAPMRTVSRHTTSSRPTTGTARRCSGSWPRPTRRPAFLTTSFTSSRSSRNWERPTGTGWRPCAGSTPRTVQPHDHRAIVRGSTRGTPTTPTTPTSSTRPS